MQHSADNQEKMENRGQTGAKRPQSSTKKKKTAKELMDKHIRDKNDVISEEDFKNLEIQHSTKADSAHDPIEINSSENRPKDEDKDHKIATPWDVISGD